MLRRGPRDDLGDGGPGWEEEFWVVALESGGGAEVEVVHFDIEALRSCVTNGRGGSENFASANCMRAYNIPRVMLHDIRGRVRRSRILVHRHNVLKVQDSCGDHTDTKYLSLQPPFEGHIHLIYF